MRKDRPRRHARAIVRLLALVAFLLLALAGGFFWFVTSLPRQMPDDQQTTDAIVVLTGGSERLAEGLRLLTEGRAKKLFVSGVYRGVDVEELLRLSRDAPENLACCIVLGYEADDTRGNARETAAWMAKEGFQSLRLVTSAYHMPRSLLELRRLMPGMEIVPHPVFAEHVRQDDWWNWPGSTNLLLQEYFKYLAAVAIGPFVDREATP